MSHRMVASLPANLSSREMDVLHWVAEGKRNQEIAIILGISSRTVDKHTQNLFNKLCVSNRTAAAAALRKLQKDLPANDGQG